MLHKKYLSFIKDKSITAVNEDIQAAKSYLKNKQLEDKKKKVKNLKEGEEVKLTPEEIQTIERNPDFLKIKEMLIKNPGWVYTFIKFRFEENINMQDLTTLYAKVKGLQDLVNRLPMPIIQYADIKPSPENGNRGGYEQLFDELEKLHRYRLQKKFVDQLPGDIRREFQNSTNPIKKKIEGISSAFDEFGKNPDGTKDEKKNAELQGLFFAKIKRYKTLHEIILASENFIKASSNEGLTKFMAAIEKCNDRFGDYGADIVYEENNIIVLEVKSFPANKELFSNTSHCIASSKGSWDSYVGADSLYTKQYYIVNFNLPPNDTKSIIGTTIQREGSKDRYGEGVGKVRNCHKKDDGSFSSELKSYCKHWNIPWDILAPMTEAEESAKKRRVIANKEIVKPKLSTDSIEKYLSDGADPNANDGIPLKNAVTENNIEGAKLLLKRGAGADVGEPIRSAKNLDMIKLLVDHGARLNAQVFQSIIKDYDAVKYCLDAGADANFEMGHPLRSASEVPNNLKVVKLLVDSGARVEERRYMAFKWACSSLNRDIMEYLAGLIKDKATPEVKKTIKREMSDWIKTAFSDKEIADKNLNVDEEIKKLEAIIGS